MKKDLVTPYAEAGELLITHIKLALTNTETGSVTYTDVSNVLRLEDGGPAASTFSNWINGKTKCSDEYLGPIAQLSSGMGEEWAPNNFINAYEYLIAYGKARKNDSLPLKIAPPELALRFIPSFKNDVFISNSAPPVTNEQALVNITDVDTIQLNQDIFALDQGDRYRHGLVSLQYARRQDDFVARDELVESFVDEFLDFEGPRNNNNLFRWTLVHGDAGIGKSRFALETLRALYEKKADFFQKKYWGFVKRDRRDSSLSLSVAKIQSWVIDGPAFLILDYAGTNSDLVDIIAALKSRALILQQPIRLMLLERRGDSGRVGDLNRIDTEDSFLRDTCYQPEGYLSGQSVGIRLLPLDDKNAALLMRKRIERERGFLGLNETDEYLCQKLDDICLGDRRPLFAAMVASAIADGDPNNFQTNSNLDRLAKRSETLHYLIRRERDKYWRDDASSSDINGLGEHENLLALATFTRGLDLTIFVAAEGMPKVRIPTADRFNIERYIRMATSSQKLDLFGLPLGFIEPDFIGEWFVLSRLSPQARIEPNVPINRPDQREFIELAWDQGQERVVQFVRQCHQNYPDEVRRMGYLLPKIGRHLKHVVPLLRDLMLDWRKEISMLRGDIQENAPQREADLIAERATEVFTMLQDHVGAAEQLDDNLRDYVAETLESYVYIQCYLVSPSIRCSNDDRLVTHSHESGRIRQRSLVETSLGIQEFLQQASLSKAVALRIADEESDGESSTKSILNHSALSLVEAYTRRNKKRSVSERITKEDQDRELIIQPTVYAIASKLLTDAAVFFRSLASRNEKLEEQMTENASVFDQMATLLTNNPGGQLDGLEFTELAGRLLTDAAGFFRTLAESNPQISNQMVENAKVYDMVAQKVVKDPFEIL